MKKKQIVLLSIVGGVALLGLLIYFLSKKKTNTSVPGDPTGDDPTVGLPHADFPLKYGSRGIEVAELQGYLNGMGANLNIDGIWGTLTGNAVQQFLNETQVSEDLFNTLG